MDDLTIPGNDPHRKYSHRNDPQGDYWRGDLLRTMLFFESSHRDFVAFALQRGYDYEPYLTIEEPLSVSASEIVPEKRVDEQVTYPPAVIRPVSERLWVPRIYLVDRFWPETDLGVHGLDKTQSSDVAVIRSEHLQQPQVKYLAAWPELRNRLDPLLGFPKCTSRLDTEVLIKRISRGYPIRQIPFYQKKRLHDQITVIKEHALHCVPYRLDQEMVVEHLSKATARGGLQVLDAFFPYGLSNTASDDSAITIRHQEVEPTPGSHILILGDLGLLLKIKDAFDQDAVEWWYKACRRWSSRGCKVFALTPFGYERIPAKLRTWIEPIAWQGDAARSLTDTQQEQGVTRLLTMAYPAQQIEPGLLRELRRMIPGLEDASLEARFWQDWRHGGPRYDAVKQTQASMRHVYKTQFELLDDSTITEILCRIRHYRIAKGCSVLWQMELMNLPKRIRDLIDPNSDEQELANQTYQALCIQMLHGGTCGLQDRLMSLSIHASEHAIDDANIGSAVRTIRNRCLPDAKRSRQTRFTELPPPVASRKVQIQCKPTGIRFLDGGKSPLNPIARGSSDCVTISSGRPILEVCVPAGSNKNPTNSFWKSGKKPDWVSDFGTDQYGAWCEFQVPKHDGKGMVTQRMRWIKPGQFLMGSPEAEEVRYEDEVPQRTVILTQGFWIADSQVTQELWMAVRGSENPSGFKGDTNPVERVSWEDCQAWINRFGEHYKTLKILLPTEAWWEYTCRAGSQAAYCFGEDPQELSKYGWFDENSSNTSHPVKQLQPNRWGVYDMHGNVWEWCSDWYGAYEKSVPSNPAGPPRGTSRVIRGGSWVSPTRVLRSTCRGGYASGYRGHYLGFRIACSAQGAEPSERATLPVAEQGTEPARPIQISVKDQQPPSSDPFWKSGAKPQWVSDYGKDQYGIWCEFQLPRYDEKGAVTQRMRWIKPGSFMMGSPGEEKKLELGDETQYEVTLTQGYWLADTQVTQELWRSVAYTNPSKFTEDTRPVEQISWKDCQQWLRDFSHFVQAINFSLPTEAQWEYACRAGSTAAYCFGDDPIELPKYGWFDKNSKKTTHPVKQLLPNGWGLYDMHGNVWEWCSNYYGTYEKSASSDPIGPARGKYRVIRGGSWNSLARNLRSACRLSHGLGVGNYDLGFRIAGSAQGAEPSERAILPVAEQGTELVRIGSDQPTYVFLRSVDLDATGENTPEEEFSSMELQSYSSIRVVSDQEGYQFDRLEKPAWAVDFGNDQYGLHASFEIASVRQRMRWIPPGRFLMGSPEGRDYGRGNEYPQHEVIITHGYWMFDTPCTQQLWSALMGENPSYFPDDDRPVETVSWEDAVAFAKKLTERLLKDHPSDENRLVDGWDRSIFRLPTEAEWEYACRAGTTWDTYQGDLDIRGDADAPLLDSIAWYGGNSGHEYDLEKSYSLEQPWLEERQYPEKAGGTRKVGLKAPNTWGLYDMLGNVWEWCQDWYGNSPTELTERRVDPTAPAQGTNRVLRGGSWFYPALNLRSACRSRFDPGDLRDDLGFRLLSSTQTAQ